jgi:hypothetical protein
MPVNAALPLRTVDPPPAGTKVPTRRFGRTEIQMPVITCGGMRAQWKWGDDSGLSIGGGGEITDECQANFDAIAERALEFGINHFETARGYGCSELQFCRTLSRMVERGVDRASFVVQTKVPPSPDPEVFRKNLQRSFDTLKPPGGYIDLFGFHGESAIQCFTNISFQSAAAQWPTTWRPRCEYREAAALDPGRVLRRRKGIPGQGLNQVDRILDARHEVVLSQHFNTANATNTAIPAIRNCRF